MIVRRPGRRVVQAHAAAAVGLDDPPVRKLVEADRLAEVRRAADLDLLVVREHGRAAVAVGRVGHAGRPVDRALRGASPGRRRSRRRCVPSDGVERAAALVVLAPGDRVVGAHRAAGDAVEHLALRLRAERILDDRGQHVRDAADVRREVVPAVVAVPVLGQVLRRVVDAVGDLDRRRLGRRPRAAAPTRRRACALVSGADSVMPGASPLRQYRRSRSSPTRVRAGVERDRLAGREARRRCRP